jgi:cytoskeletal protein CcmA (bactofilin family)
LSYFSQPKNERDKSLVNATEREVRFDEADLGDKSSETVSALGRGMLITGNIVCAGSMQIFGRVVGDIHAAKLTIGEGARVEGNIIAQETAIQGFFKGTLRSNGVKLQSTAVVDGEILNKSLTIEQSAQFEGVARRLDRPVDAPSSEQVTGERPGAPMAELVPIS